MSVDTKLQFSEKINWAIVLGILAKHYDPKIQVNKGSTDDCVFMVFQVNETEQRQLFLIYNPETPNSQTSLSLRCWGHAVEIMRTIGSYLGGVLVADDSDDTEEVLIPTESLLEHQMVELQILKQLMELCGLRSEQAIKVIQAVNTGLIKIPIATPDEMSTSHGSEPHQSKL